MNQSFFSRKEELKKAKDDLSNKIEKLEEKYIEGEISKELYEKFRLKYESQIAEIATEAQKQVSPLSNPEKFIDFSLSLCQNLSKTWASGDLDKKLKFQKILFPDGLAYDLQNHTYRTSRINSVILQISQLAGRAGEIDHLRPDQSDQPGRFKLTTRGRSKLTT